MAARRIPIVLVLVGVLVATVAPPVRADGTLLPAPGGHRTQPTRAGAALSGLVTLGSAVTIHGRGWGHGVGLSQYGARGRALAGQTTAAILAHYYQGTTPGSLDPSSPIRVLVLSGWTASPTAPLVMRGRGGPWTVDGIAMVFPADASLRLTPTITSGAVAWRLKVTASGGAVLHDAPFGGSFRVRPAAEATTLQLDSKPGSNDRYRGVLRVIGGTTAPSVTVVNELALDAYLRGVVPAEMPSTWPTEALRAQAIVARSYAARRLRPGVSYYDVTDDTSSQVYLGVVTEKASTDAAIAATSGQVLRYGSEIALTVFHSTAGGATEHNENVFVSSSGAKTAGPVAYLRGVADRTTAGVPYDAGAPYATWQTATYSVAQLSAFFGADPRTAVGTVTKLDLRNRGVSGRLVSVTLIGTTGQKTVSGDVFRSVFNAKSPLADPAMRSNLFDLKPVP